MKNILGLYISDGLTILVFIPIELCCLGFILCPFSVRKSMYKEDTGIN